MKKFLSIFLAVAFVFSAMCMSVLADNVTASGEYPVVGTQGGNSGIDNGVSSWTDTDLKNNNADIFVDFSNPGDPSGSTIHNRYAVDITYANLTIDLAKITDNEGNPVEYVWDVDNHVYVITGGGSYSANTDEITIENAFFVTNHSDLEVYYTPVLTNSYSEILDMSIRSEGFKNLNGGAASIEDSMTPGTFMVKRATAGSYTIDNGDATMSQGEATNGLGHIIVTEPKEDWLVSINALSSAIDNPAIAGGAVIGTLTVTIVGKIDAGTTVYDATNATP